MRPLAPLLVLACGAACGLAAAPARAATYEVGPSFAYTTIGAVPWESLAAGDTVRIHARPAPYAEKWVICAQGTAAQPISVVGVPDGGGNLPVVTGEDATTRAALNFWNEDRAIVKIGGANVPACETPAFVVVEGLHLRRARPPYRYTGRSGGTYATNASTIYVEAGHDITIRGCLLEEAGNGLFSSWQVENLLVEGNLIQGNGNVSSIYEHNAYTAGKAVTYRANRFGPLCAGCSGNNLKDRSAGTVIEANWIEGGNRQLDLVDGEDDPSIPADPRYGDTYVAGNVLLESGDDGNSQIVHFGGDSGNTASYRPRLWFWNNTVVSTRTGHTTLLRLSSPSQQAHLDGNVVWASAGGANVAMVDADGQVAYASNWLPAGWRASHGLPLPVTTTLTDLGDNVAGLAPGFVDPAAQDFSLAAGSPCLGAAGALPAQTTAHPLDAVYVPHQQTLARAGPPSDLGAFWAGGGPPPAPAAPAIPSPGGGGCGCGAGGGGGAVLGLLGALAARRRRGPR